MYSNAMLLIVFSAFQTKWENIRVNMVVITLFIEPGSPWENGYIESFNGKMRDELLAGEIFYSLKEAQVLIEMCRMGYNTVRPHSSLDYKPPAPEAVALTSTHNQDLGLTQNVVQL